MYLRMYVLTYVCMYVLTYVCMYVLIYVCMYLRICVCMYTCYHGQFKLWHTSEVSCRNVTSVCRVNSNTIDGNCMVDVKY